MVLNLIKTKHVIKILLVIFICLFFPFSANAQETKFSIDYDLSYDIGLDGETIINQKTVITNLQNDVIPTTYSFSAKQLKIYDIRATTNGKEAKPKIEDNGEDNIISVIIQNYAIGEGRRNEISLEYKTKSIASKSGKIWNIYIPKIQIPDSTTLYNVKLSVPKVFGPRIYLSPTPVIEKSENDKIEFYFTKETFRSSGITAAFGEYQPVNFKLKYQLKNNSIIPLIKEIALPSDIREYQSVSYQKIDPKPFKIKLDKDNNVIASYILGPKKQIQIELTGTSRIYGKQINPDIGRDFSSIPSDLIKKYTRSQEYWESDSPLVQKIAQELKDNNLNVTKNAQKIYNFINNNLDYDYEAIEKGLAERKGAELVLSKDGKWTCMEFADLFIAIARAMGIPAREVNGYAFTFDDNNKPISINLNGGDYLHSWAEFYDQFYGWVQIDPTWGTTSGIDYFTKLDTNHFAFVTKGIDSEFPYPAGTYRFSEKEKLIEVALSQTTSDEDFKPSIEVKKIINFNFFQAFKGKIKVEIKNSGKVTAYKVLNRTIPANGIEKIYIEKDQKNVIFEDLHGQKYSQDIIAN